MYMEKFPAITDTGIDLHISAASKEILLEPLLNKIGNYRLIWTRFDIHTQKIVGEFNEISSSVIDDLTDSLLNFDSEVLETILSIAEKERIAIAEVIKWNEEESHKVSSIIAILIHSIVSVLRGKGAIDYIEHERSCIERLKKIEILQGMIRLALTLRALRTREDSVEVFP